MSNGRWRPRIEAALKLSLRDLMRHGVLRRGETRRCDWQWPQDGERPATITMEATLPECGRDLENGHLRLIYTAKDRQDVQRNFDYGVHLTATPMRFGGVRWWFRCPYTDRRCLTLLKFAGVDKFCARAAIRPLPTYACQRGSRMAAIQMRRLKIRRRLDCIDEYFAPLERSKWMRRSTFQRWCELDAYLERAEDSAFQERWGASWLDR